VTLCDIREALVIVEVPSQSWKFVLWFSFVCLCPVRIVGFTESYGALLYAHLAISVVISLALVPFWDVPKGSCLVVNHHAWSHEQQTYESMTPEIL
jgi:hypothetical protein